MAVTENCDSCVMYNALVLDLVQLEREDNRTADIPDNNVDYWTRENVQHAARSTVRALTRGAHHNSSRERIAAAQGYVSVIAEPVRAAIVECDTEFLHEMLNYLCTEILPSLRDRKRRRMIRIVKWIRLEIEWPSYHTEAREMTDNEFIAQVAREFNSSRKA